MSTSSSSSSSGGSGSGSGGVLGNKTRSIAVLIGAVETSAGTAGSTDGSAIDVTNDSSSPSSSSLSLSKTNHSQAASVPIVVWTLQERPSHLRNVRQNENQNQQQEQSQNQKHHAINQQHKYDLVYYEFLDDTARWTHLDQLLLQLYDDTNNNNNNNRDDSDDNDNDDNDDNDGAGNSSNFLRRSRHDDDDLPSLHVGSSENLEKVMKAMMTMNDNKGRNNRSTNHDDSDNNKSNENVRAPSPASIRTKRLVESLQSFLEDRFNLKDEDNNTDGDDGDNNPNQKDQQPSRNHHFQPRQQQIQQRQQHSMFNGGGIVHVHWNVPVQAHCVESSLQQLLLDDEEAQLTVRGNVQLSQPFIRQGLAMWLQSQGLYNVGSSNTTTTTSNTSLLRLDVERSVYVKCGNHDLTSHLVMDRTAAQAIHLLPPPNDGVATVVGGTYHNNSLFGLLSKYCQTTMGKKVLNLWLRQPLTDLRQIEHRQDAVTDLLGVSRDAVRGGLRSFAGGVGQAPLVKLASALARYRPHDDDDDQDDDSRNNIIRVGDIRKAVEILYKLYVLSSRHLPNLLDCMEDLRESSSTILVELYQQVSKLESELKHSVGLAEAVVDLDVAPRVFQIKPSFSPELEELHRLKMEVEQAVDDEHNAIEDAWNDLGLDTTTSKKGGSKNVRLERVDNDSCWHFRLPSTKHAKHVDGLGRKMQTHKVQKNGVYFSSLELRQLSQKYRDLDDEYSNKSRTLVADALSVAASYSTAVERAAETIGRLDMFCALAHTAAMSPNGYCRPKMTDSDEDGSIHLVGARHPCLEVQEGMDFIPNDVELKFPQAQLLVSGPNCGGKSVYIRSIGAIVCLAQIGSYVPCTSATINICHSILARVGAGDLQDRGISTFMAEMLEASSILKSATKRSLIIIDELGRGTSTFDGYGLARAIMQYLMEEVGCFVVFATHFHELTHLDGVKNCHVTAQKGNQGLTFLYEVREGPCLESFGIQVAEMANMPRVCIEDAKKRARELESFTDTSDGEAQKKVAKFAHLDLPSFLQETQSCTPQERKAKLLQLLSA